jgi:chromosome segregation ATPase
MSFKTVTIFACVLMAFSAMNVSLDFEEGPVVPKEQPKPRPVPTFSFPKIEPQPERKVDFPPFPFLDLPAPKPREEPKPEPEKKRVEFPPFPFPFPVPKKVNHHETESKQINIVIPNFPVEEKKEDDGNCIRSLKTANEKIAHLMKQLNDSVPKSEVEDINALKNLVKKLEAENSHLKSKFGKLFETIGQKRDEKNENNEDELIATISEKEAQIKKLSEDNKKLFNDNRALNGIVRKLKEELEAVLRSKSKEADNSKLIEENKSLREKLSHLEGRFAALQIDFDRLGKMSIELIKIKKEFEAITRERDNLLKQIDELNDLAEKNKKLMNDNTKLFQDNKSISIQVAKLSKENEELNRKVEEARAFASKFRAEIDELKKTIAGLTIRLDISGKQQNNSDEFRKQASEFKGIIVMLEKRIQSFEEEKRELRIQIDSLRQETATLQLTINKQNNQIEDWRKKCSSSSAPAPAITLPPIFNLPNISHKQTETKKNSRNTFIGTSLQNQDLD